MLFGITCLSLCTVTSTQISQVILKNSGKFGWAITSVFLAAGLVSRQVGLIVGSICTASRAGIRHLLLLGHMKSIVVRLNGRNGWLYDGV